MVMDELDQIQILNGFFRDLAKLVGTQEFITLQMLFFDNHKIIKEHFTKVIICHFVWDRVKW